MTCQLLQCCSFFREFLVIATLKAHKKEDNKAQMINVNISMSTTQFT